MKKQKTQIVSEEILVNKIHIIRGQKVMFDRDLAILYGVPPTRFDNRLSEIILDFLKILCFS